MEDKIKSLQEMLDESKSVVFFGGAGVSTESGIPDFRSVDGLYNQKYDYPPEEILSATFFKHDPETFFRFYREKLDIRGAKPNAAHNFLARLEEAGKLRAVITQNIDGLHQAAGSRNVLELHGTLLRNYCSKCGRSYGSDYVWKTQGVPRCTCGGVVRPDIVLYEEGLDSDVLRRSVDALSRADMLIVGGTSLAVYPAAGLVRYFGGRHLAVINLQPTGLDSSADLCIAQPIGKVFDSLRVK